MGEMAPQTHGQSFLCDLISKGTPLPRGSGCRHVDKQEVVGTNPTRESVVSLAGREDGVCRVKK